MVSALLPLLLMNYYGHLDRPMSKFFDDDFDPSSQRLWYPRLWYPLATSDIFDPSFPRPGASQRTDIFKYHADNEKFVIKDDVRQFKPEEVKVKIVDNFIVVKAKHEETKNKHDYVAWQFARRYNIPTNVDPDTITSEISSDGVLTIKAPVKQNPEDKNEPEIKMEMTSKPALKPPTEKQQPEDSKTDSSTAAPNAQESTTPQK